MGVFWYVCMYVEWVGLDGGGWDGMRGVWIGVWIGVWMDGWMDVVSYYSIRE